MKPVRTLLALVLALPFPAFAGQSAVTLPVTTAPAAGVDGQRIAAMKQAVDIARKALEGGKAAGDERRVPLLERRLAILTERLDLLEQISTFRQAKREAERRGDFRARDDAEKKIAVAYQIIASHQGEERQIRKDLEKGEKGK